MKHTAHIEHERQPPYTLQAAIIEDNVHLYAVPTSRLEYLTRHPYELTTSVDVKTIAIHSKSEYLADPQKCIESAQEKLETEAHAFQARMGR